MTDEHKQTSTPKVQFILNQYTEPEFHHNRMELLFVLSGNLQVSVNQNDYMLTQEDLIFINPYELHMIHKQKNANYISLMVEMTFIQDLFPMYKEMTIDFKSIRVPQDKEKHIQAVRALFAKIFQITYKSEVGYELEMMGEVLKLFKILVASFSKCQTVSASPISNESMGHIQKLTRYIHNHYTENMTLNELANMEYLTPQYVSRLFQKQMHTTLTQYITSVRLNHAYAQLIRREHSITEIAYNNGFKNVNAFITSFQKKFGMTPGQFKKNHTTQHEEVVMSQAINGEDLSQSQDIFSVLLKYTQELVQLIVPSKQLQRNQVQVDSQATGVAVSSGWKRLLNVANAKDILNGNVKIQIQEIQDKMGFEYLRCHGLLDDDMFLYHEDAQGKAVLNYVYVDQVMDFILSVGLLPFVEFGYMPTGLAKESITFFLRQSNMSMPKSMAKWEALIGNLTVHFVERYGIKCVEKWRFTLFNRIPFEKNSEQMSLEYADLYQSTYQSVKAVSTKLQIGVNVTTAVNEEGIFEQDLLVYCKRHHLVPDFLTFQCFMGEEKAQEEDELRLVENDEAFPFAVSRNEDLLKQEINLLQNLKAQYGYEHLELYMTEWNSNIWQRDLCNDTCYKAAFLAKNIVENYERLGAFGYWTLSDYMEETWPSQYLFHGGFGLYTQNSIRKSVFYAMTFINELGTMLIHRGERYIVTREGDEIQILLYNYCHFDQLYRYRHVTHIDQWNRYEVFINTEEQHFTISISVLEKGRYKIQKYALNREHGSAFDKWLEIGAPEQVMKEDIRYIQQTAIPEYQVRYERCENIFEVETILAPHEVQLIKIIKI